MPEQIGSPEGGRGNTLGIQSPQNKSSGNEAASALVTLGARHPTALEKVGGIHHLSHNSSHRKAGSLTSRARAKLHSLVSRG